MSHEVRAAAFDVYRDTMTAKSLLISAVWTNRRHRWLEGECQVHHNHDCNQLQLGK